MTDWLDRLYRINCISGLDRSFSKRMHLFDRQIRDQMQKDFLERYNGLMLCGEDDMQRVLFSCFLSDAVVQELVREQCGPALLVTHHMLNIDAGRPGRYDAKGYCALGIDSFLQLKKRGVSVYVIHLPLDCDHFAINTHRALCNKLDLTPREPLLERTSYQMGYLATGDSFLYQKIRNNFDQCVCYGAAPPSSAALKGATVGILSGMISTPAMLAEIVQKGCRLCICGDALLRNNTIRCKEMEQCLQNSPISFLCLSHKQSEEPALLELMNLTAKTFPGLQTEFIRGGLAWQ